MLAQDIMPEPAQARSDHPELPELPDAVFDAMVGAINELVFELVRQGRSDELPSLENTIFYMQVATFAGHERARALLDDGDRV